MAGVPYNPLAASLLPKQGVDSPLSKALEPTDQFSVLRSLMLQTQPHQEAIPAYSESAIAQALKSDINRNINSVASALMAPGDALSGKYNYVEIEPDGYVRPFNSGLINAANNMAGVVGVSSLGIPRPSGSLGSGGSNFDRWFGNSQVRNPDGTPKTLYHGTTGNFDTFRVPVDGAGNPRAVYLTPDAQVASMYAAGKGSVIPAYVKAEKLLTVDFKGGSTDSLGRSRERVVREAREQGYDGVLLKNTGDVGGNQDQYAVFNPAQIKSSIGNSGAYNPADPSIVRLSGVPIVSSEKNGER